MSHSNTARMLGYWESRRGREPAPARSSIDPAEFSDVVTQAFVLGRERVSAFPFRLAGALLDDLHHGPLTGQNFIDMWTAADRPRVQAVLKTALQQRQSAILYARGRSASDRHAHIEILLAPLTGPKGEVDRLLGLYQPVSMLFRLNGEKLEQLDLKQAVLADGSEPGAGPVRLVAVDGRKLPSDPRS